MKDNSAWVDPKAMRSPRRPALGLARIALPSALLHLASLARTRGDDRADYQYQDYAEEAGRIHVQTHGFFFDAPLKPWISLKGSYVHDAISGATPTGAPPLPGQSSVATVTIDEIRNAGFLAAAMKLGEQTFTPQFSYSEESDYKSTGISLNYAIDLNEKNTTLNAGASYSFDQILPHEGESITSVQDKNASDLLLGVTQVLGPKTVLTANLAFGYADGYLTDPYKRVLFTGFPYNPGQPYTVFPENRPGHRFREVVFVSMQQFVEKLNGAADLSYRFYHDDFGVTGNTVAVQWNQNIGKHVMISPLFRFYTQTEAHFYATSFPGDPSIPGAALPNYYSADYRISALNSYTYGVSISAKVQKHISLQVAYQRYNMVGTDANTYGQHGATADAQYPRANIFTGGLTVWF